MQKGGTDKLFAERPWRHGHWEQTCGQGPAGEGGRHGESDTEHTLPYAEQTTANGKLLYDSELKPELHNNHEGWDGEGGGKDVQVGGDMGKPVADSCWRLVEINTIL